MVRKRVITLGLILGLAGIQSAYSIDWKMVKPDSYIDNDSIQKIENSPFGRNIYSYLTMDRKIGKQTFGENFDYGIFQYLVNCDAKRGATKAISVFDKKGNVLLNTIYNDNELNWQSITQDSMNEYFYNLCCNPDNKITKSESNSATQIYDNTVKSAVYIETKDKIGTPLMSGSGVIVLEDGTLVTCFHVIANADVIEVKLNDGSIYKVNGFRYLNPIEDIAILTLDTTRKYTPIKINNTNVKIGEKVYALANPQGLQFTFADGMINQQKDGMLQFSAPASQGSSGGALLNDKGELIGIISSQYNPAESQNINFAISNKFYTSKLQNFPIKNVNNLGWTDFIVSKADSEQLKIYASVAAYNENYELLYKSLKPLSQRPDFPKDRYALMGFIAMSADNYKESLGWFNKSIENGYYQEMSAFCICLLSMFSEEQIWNSSLSKGLEYLKPYKTSYDLIKSTENKVLKCYGNMECKAEIIGETENHLRELYNKMIDTMDNYNNFENMR